MESNMELELRSAKEEVLKSLCGISNASVHITCIDPDAQPAIRVVSHALSEAREAIKVAIREIEEFTIMHVEGTKHE